MTLPKRRKNRLENYDYGKNGAYFITVCVKDRKEILCHIVGADTIRPCKIILSRYGKVVDEAIRNIPLYYDNVSIPSYVIMPDHIHIILVITDNGGRMVSAPTVIAGMKRFVSKTCGVSIWQKGFYDHIIRNQEDYNEIYQYIENNPEKWLLTRQIKAQDR